MKSKTWLVVPILNVLFIKYTWALHLNNESGRRWSRRSVLGHGISSVVVSSAAAAATAVSPASMITDRLETEVLKMPASTNSDSGVDNLYYPPWMEGTWKVQQTLVRVSAPLGEKFVGGPNGSEEIAAASLAEAREKIGVPVALRLRYLGTKWGVAEDRAFNQKARLDAFAGRVVVSTVDYADTRASNRNAVLAGGGSEDDPLATTVVRYRGPAAQKTFVLSHGSTTSVDGTAIGTSSLSTWSGYEVDRSIFALTNQNTAPPLTTDTEIIWTLARIDDDHVVAKLRLAGYLNAQSDKLYFDARQRAVSIQDYDLDFVRMK